LRCLTSGRFTGRFLHFWEPSMNKCIYVKGGAECGLHCQYG
jgi:hypothetical protein